MRGMCGVLLSPLLVGLELGVSGFWFGILGLGSQVSGQGALINSALLKHMISVVFAFFIWISLFLGFGFGFWDSGFGF